MATSSPGSATVLVVDDDKNDCEVLRAELSGQGCRPVVACNGREALAYLRGGEPLPKLILLDLMMPVMTGWQFREAQQEDPALSGIPVAIITGLPEAGEKAASELGAVDVLTKPSRVESITALVARFCR